MNDETKISKLRDTSDTFVGCAYSSLYRGTPWHRAKRFVGVKFSRSIAFTHDVFDSQVLPALIKSEFDLHLTCKIDMIRQPCVYCC